MDKEQGLTSARSGRAVRAAASNARGPRCRSGLHPERKIGAWIPSALLGGLLAAALQFQSLDKPFHIDDYLFVRVAKNLLRFPDAPFVGQDLFTGADRDLYVHNNPPLVPAVLALGLSVLGEEDPVGLHLTLFPFTVLAIVAFAFLASQFCSKPMIPTLLWASSVPLILSGTHLMSDVPAIALALASLALVQSSENTGWRRLLWAPAGIALGLALVAKYSMAFFSLLVPVVAWHRGMHWSRLLALVILAALPSTFWAVQNLLVHGELHLLASGRQGADSPLGLQWMEGWWIEQKALASLAALGEVGLVPLLPLLLAFVWRPRWVVLACGLLTIWLCTLLPGYSPQEILQFGLWTGLGSLSICVAACSPAPRFLKVWFFALTGLTVLIFPFASTRFLLPCIPPLLLMVWKEAENCSVASWLGWPLVLAQIALTFGAAEADYRYARLYPGLAERAALVAKQQGVQLWFAAEGALRPELERRGARYLRSRVDRLPEGDLVAIGVNCHHYGLSPRLSTVLYEQTVLNSTFGPSLRLESSEARAGFYAHPNGYLPIALSDVEAESVYLFRVGPPNPFAQQFLEHRESLAVQGQIVENVHQFKRGFWPSFLAHPPSKVRFQVQVPAGSRLRFGFGLREEISGPRYGDGVTFRVFGRRSEDLEKPRLLFEKLIDPKNRPADRILHLADVVLSELDGELVEFDFENDCGPASNCAYDWALWTMPELVSKEAK